MNLGLETGYSRPKKDFLNLAMLQNGKTKVTNICIYELCVFYSNYFQEKHCSKEKTKWKQSKESIKKKKKKTEMCCAILQPGNKLEVKAKAILFCFRIHKWNGCHEDAS